MKVYTYLKLLFLYWLPVFVWMGIIFYLSSKQSFSVSSTYTWNFIFHKTMHLMVFGGLFFVLFRAYHKSFTHVPVDLLFLAAIITGVLYGATDEVHQTFVQTREGTLRDVGIDTIGILIVFEYTKSYLSKLKWLL